MPHLRIAFFTLFLHFNFLLAQETDTVKWEKVRIDEIIVRGNKTTKEHIITRELTFQQGDTLKSTEIQQALDRSRENLMNTSLFNFIDIKKVRPDSVSIKIFIEVAERWYIWPLPIFELAEPNFNTWWQHKNFSRTNYGFYIVWENFRGRMETIQMKAQMGFDQELAMKYSLPYINKKRTIGLGLTAGFSRNHEIFYATNSHLRTFLNDDEKHVRQEFFSRITFTQRNKLDETHRYELQYVNTSIADTITKLSNDYLKSNATNMQYLSIIYQFKHDKRDYKYYPLTGYMFQMNFSKHGFGIFNRQGLNVLFAYLSARYHWQHSDRFYSAIGYYGKFSLLQDPPYYLQRGLGYGDFVRGYEYYVIDGQHYGLLRGNLKYQIVKTKEENIEFIPTEKFSRLHYSVFANVFADVGYAKDQLYFGENPLANELLFGAGIGLDILTYYDTVMRMEFSVNKSGEFTNRDGDNTFFSIFKFHFTKPI